MRRRRSSRRRLRRRWITTWIPRLTKSSLQRNQKRSEGNPRRRLSSPDLWWRKRASMRTKWRRQEERVFSCRTMDQTVQKRRRGTWWRDSVRRILRTWKLRLLNVAEKLYWACFSYSAVCGGLQGTWTLRRHSTVAIRYKERSMLPNHMTVHFLAIHPGNFLSCWKPVMAFWTVPMLGTNTWRKSYVSWGTSAALPIHVCSFCSIKIDNCKVWSAWPRMISYTEVPRYTGTRWSGSTNTTNLENSRLAMDDLSERRLVVEVMGAFWSTSLCAEGESHQAHPRASTTEIWLLLRGGGQ